MDGTYHALKLGPHGGARLSVRVAQVLDGDVSLEVGDALAQPLHDGLHLHVAHELLEVQPLGEVQQVVLLVQPQVLELVVRGLLRHGPCRPGVLLGPSTRTSS